MPQLQTITLAAVAIKNGDMYDDQIVATVKKGTKWAELRDLDGKLIGRLLLDTTISVRRMMDTPEETAAKIEAYEVSWLMDALDKGLRNTPTSAMQDLIELADNRGRQTGLLDSWEFERLMTVQAEYNFFSAVQRTLNCIIERETESEYAPVKEAFANVIASRLRHININPLSRSTSPMGNIIDDMDVYIARKFLDSHRTESLREMVHAALVGRS